MKLAHLIESQGLAEAQNGLEISGLSADSRTIKAGFLFAALPGNKANGVHYIDQAINNGAVAIIVEKQTLTPEQIQHYNQNNIVIIEVDNARLALAKAAARFFGKQPDYVAAVTGTSGKTSTVSFLRQIWEFAGLKAASLGTNGVEAQGLSRYNGLTTPGPVALQQDLAFLADNHITHLAMEASSHGLDQYRLDGVRLQAAGYTNLGRDHMDYHDSVENYFAAKMHLFDRLLPLKAPSVVFADDVYSAQAISHIVQAGRHAFSVGEAGDFIRLITIERHQDYQLLTVEHDHVTYNIKLPLAGDFQVANALVAAGLALVSGVQAKLVFEAMQHLRNAPGRLELVGHHPKGGAIYVDYAHKPEALQHVLQSLRPFTQRQLIVVFGCGGDRDKGKRPIMGKIAVDYADQIIVTDDNPRSEDPAEIRAEILAAAPGAIEIGDRHQAIATAIAQMQKGDVLVIAGKGHETGQIVGDKVLPFSDQEEVLKALKAIKDSDV